MILLAVLGSLILLAAVVLWVVWAIERGRNAQSAIQHGVWWEPGDFWSSRERQRRAK